MHLYARSAPHPVHYVRIHAGETLGAFIESLERAIDSAVDPTRIFEAFSKQVMELVVDEIDNADEGIRAFLQALPNRIPHNVTLVYVSRSNRIIDLVSLVPQGIAVIMDRVALAFSQREAMELCECLGLQYSAPELSQLVNATEGWAFALTGTLRDAAYECRGLRGAFNRWHDRYARLILHLVERSLVDLSQAERAAAERIYAGEKPGTTAAYAHLHDCGLLFSFSDSELRPLRGISAGGARQAQIATPITLPVAVIEMFGEFRMEIEGRRVEWFRRRDRQLIAFIALQPQAKASRTLVLSTFWPEAEPHLAAQSLRTACSTIRRAIAKCVGYDRVDSYFVAGRELRLDADYVSITSQRLHAHIEAGEEAFTDGNSVAARGHYLAACRLYAGPLLDDDGAEPWVQGSAESFAAMVAVAAERSLEIRDQRRDDGPLATSPARLLLSG